MEILRNMNAFIQSIRMRTLPLSVAGIVLGTGLAWSQNGWVLSACDSGIWVFILAALTAMSLQILSNLSNELGDANKGTDADQHGRAAYGLQSGKISIRQMQGMIGLFIGVCVMLGMALIYAAFWCPAPAENSVLSTLVFLGLGLAAIIGAMTYTLGKHSYGYMGLGDLGVMIFFGLLSTIGGYYLQTQQFNWSVFWSCIAIGLPCVGVLNLNNIRDMANDRAHGKRTFAAWLGPIGARIYHYLLLSFCLLIFILQGHYWVALIVPVWAWHCRFVATHETKLDKQMPVLMFSTLAVALLAII